MISIIECCLFLTGFLVSNQTRNLTKLYNIDIFVPIFVTACFVFLAFHIIFLFFNLISQMDKPKADAKSDEISVKEKEKNEQRV
jgi:uncharacterized membrane protein